MSFRSIKSLIKPHAILATLLLVGSLFLIKAQMAQATARTWDGGGSDGACGGLAGDGNKWSCALNWSGDIVPTSSDNVIFDGTSTKNATIDAGFQGTITGMAINSGYTGTITQATALTINGNYSQATGTFTGASQSITINGSYSLSGGTFTSTSGTLQITTDFTVTGSPTFTHNSGTVNFQHFNTSSTLSCGNVTFNLVTFTNSHFFGSTETVGSNCTIPLGNSPTVDVYNGTFINNGIVNAGTGTLTISGNYTGGATGTLTITGAAMSVGGNFTLNSGTTFPASVTLTLTGSSTLSCNNVTFAQVIITNPHFSGANIVVGSNCTLPFGNNPTVDYYNGNFTNNGTITSGTGTLTMTGNFTNSATGTVTMSGTAFSLGGNFTLTAGGTFPTGLTITETGSGVFSCNNVSIGQFLVTNPHFSGSSVTIGSDCTMPVGNSATLDVYSGNFTNNGTITAGTGTLTMTGNFTNGATGTVTMTGTAFNVGGNFTLTHGGTFPTGLTITETGSGTFACDNISIGRFLATNPHFSGSTVVIGSDCTMPVGNSATLDVYSGNFTNNGTITAGTGTLTMTGNYIQNSGATLTISGTDLVVGGNLTANGGSFPVLPYAVGGNLTNSSNALPNGIALTLNTGAGATVDCGTAQFSSLTINKSSATTLSSNCTVTGDFTRTAGVVNNPGSARTIFVGGNLSYSSADGFGGANLTTELNGTGTQNITNNNNFLVLSAPLRINKSSGSAVLTTNFGITSAACTVVTGTFYLNGKDFTCATAFTVQSGGNLQLMGGESVTTPTLNNDSTVTYKGNGDGLADNYTTQSWSYSNLVINATDSNDTFGAVNTISSGLAGYWKLDDGTGSSAADSSASGITGTLVNMENGDWDSSDKPTLNFSNSNSLRFNNGSSDEYINLGTPNQLDDLQVPMTISGWFKEDGSKTNPTIYGQYAGTSGHQLIKLVRLDNNHVNYFTSTAGGGFQTNASSGAYTENAWHFFAVTVSGSIASPTVSIRLDGTTDVYSFSALSSTPLTTVTNRIGGAQSNIASEYMGGWLDDIRVYDRALSASEVGVLAAGNNSNVVSSITVGKDFTVSNGIFVSPATFNVAGNFNHSGGTFTHNSGTVVLNGTDQTITGSTTFNNLTKTITSPSRTLTFPAGAAQTVAGTLDLEGTSGNLLLLRSSASPTQWDIAPLGTKTLQFLDVMDSNNTSGSAITTLGLNITDSGNNTGWTFNHNPTAPTSLGGANYVDGSWGNDNTLTLTFNLADSDVGDTVKYQIQIDNNSNFGSPEVDYTSALGAQGSFSFTVGQAAGGGSYTAGSGGQTLPDLSGYYWRVKTIDNNALASSFSTANGGSIAFKIDTTAPVAGTMSFTAVTGTSITAQVAGASDALSGLATFPYTFTNTTSSQTSGAQSSTSWVNSGLSGSTNYSYQVLVSDLAGNTATATGSQATSATGGGGIPPQAQNPPTPPPGGFSVSINSGATSTTNASVTLTLVGGPDAVNMAVSNDPNFLSIPQTPYTTTKDWNLCATPQNPNPTSCPFGTYTVYVKFYTSYGQASSTVSDTIILANPNPPPTPTPPPPVPNPPPTPSPTPPPSQCTLTKDQVNANFKAAMQKAKADYEAIVQPALQQKQDKIITAQRYQDIHQQQSDIWNAAKAKARADRKLALSKVCTVIPPEPPIPIPTPPPLPPSQPPVTPPTQTPPPPSNVPPVNQPPVTPPGGTTTPPSNQPPSNNPPGNTPGNIPGNETGEAGNSQPGVIQQGIDDIANFIERAGHKVAESTKSLAQTTSDVAMNTLQSLPISQQTIKAANAVAAVVAIPATTLASYSTILSLASGSVALTDLWLLFYRWLLNLASLVGLRKKRKYWGTVYDSVTKQPLDPAIVTLIDAVTGRQVEQSITDLFGRFGFLVLPGTYIIKAEKTNYAFPSKKILENSDGMFDNLYHGQTITITSSTDVVTPNIPMDPLAFDWNQQDKQRIVKYHPIRERLLHTIATFIFLVGFVLAIFVTAAHPGKSNFAILAIYAAVMIVRLLHPPQRLWGRLILKPNNTPITNARIRLTMPGLDNVVLGKAQTGPDGRFFLKGPKAGAYQISISQAEGNELLWKGQTTLGKDGVLNKDIILG